jgi:hypothetical protein
MGSGISPPRLAQPKMVSILLILRCHCDYALLMYRKYMRRAALAAPRLRRIENIFSSSNKTKVSQNCQENKEEELR